MTSHPNPTTSRPLQSDADYWHVHQLLRKTVRTAPPGFNWDIRRWEGHRFYDPTPTGDPAWAKNGRLWETVAGQLVGLVHPGGTGLAYLEIDPGYRHLEPEMIEWAETHLRGPIPNGAGTQLLFFVYAYDHERQARLADRGYAQQPYGGVIRQMKLGKRPLPTPTLAAGYTLHNPNPELDEAGQQIADLLNAAFGRTFHTAAEYQWFTRHAPSFRQYLDLVAVAPNGRFASYVGIPYDDLNRRGIFEPVCTHPDHRQRGLGKALMQEGLRRLQIMGAIDVTVETGDAEPANALYNSLGFTTTEKGYYWRKQF